MDDIPIDKLQDGMLCYITSKQQYYQWTNNKWDKFLISSDIKRVNTIEDLDLIDTSELLEGVMCFIKSKGKYYVWNSIKWTPLIIEDGMDGTSKVYIVQTQKEMEDLPKRYNIIEGCLCYLKDVGMYYKYVGNNTWNQFNYSETYYVGQEVIIDSKEPDDKSVLWVDTSDTYIEGKETLIENVIIQEILNSVKDMRESFQKEINLLKAEIKELRTIIESGDIVTELKDCFLSEEGDFFMTEDGDYIVSENAVESQPKGDFLLTEDGFTFATEDNTMFVLESSVDEPNPPKKGNFLLAENNDTFTTENG